VFLVSAFAEQSSLDGRKIEPYTIVIMGTGVSASLGRWLWNLVCFVWSDNLVRTLM
jgi:hypothetical protein